MIIVTMEVLVTIVIIITVTMITYRRNSMKQKKKSQTRNWSGKHA